MKNLLLMLVLILSYQNLAHASAGKGNGGDVVKCSAKGEKYPYDGYYFLDYALTSNPKLLLKTNMSAEDIILTISDQLSKMPELQKDLRDYIKMALSSDETKEVVWRTNLEKLNNAYLIDEKVEMYELPENCTFHTTAEGLKHGDQAVVRKIENGKIVYYYNPKYISQLAVKSQVQLSMLFFHEFLWKYTQDITVLRQVNNIVHTNDFIDSYSPSEIKKIFEQNNITTENVQKLQRQEQIKLYGPTNFSEYMDYFEISGGVYKSSPIVTVFSTTYVNPKVCTSHLHNIRSVLARVGITSKLECFGNDEMQIRGLTMINAEMHKTDTARAKNIKFDVFFTPAIRSQLVQSQVESDLEYIFSSFNVRVRLDSNKTMKDYGATHPANKVLPILSVKCETCYVANTSFSEMMHAQMTPSEVEEAKAFYYVIDVKKMYSDHDFKTFNTSIASDVSTVAVDDKLFLAHKTKLKVMSEDFMLFQTYPEDALIHERDVLALLLGPLNIQKVSIKKAKSESQENVVEYNVGEYYLTK